MILRGNAGVDRAPDIRRSVREREFRGVRLAGGTRPSHQAGGVLNRVRPAIPHSSLRFMVPLPGFIISPRPAGRRSYFRRLRTEAGS